MSKTKILVTFAVAICALTASVAPASAFFHVKEYPVKIHGQNIPGVNEQITINGSILECETVHYYGDVQMTTDSSQVKVGPEYLKCTMKIAGGSATPMTVRANGCQYNFHQAKTATTGTVSVECPSGTTIELETKTLFGTCIIKIGTQRFLKGITYTNQVGPPKTILVKAVVPGIVIGAVSAICEAAGIKAGSEVEYKGEAKFEAQKENSPFEQVDIEVI